MKLSELISAYGDDKVCCQRLDECATSLNASKRGASITFGTSEPLNLNGTVKLGLVIWLDRERVADIIATFAQEPTNGMG